MNTEPRPFDVCGPLPGPGVTVLEASAGTGKTFTITALITRFVAEGVVPLDQLLAVTFTRMATGELRDRVRRQLVTSHDLLARHLHAGEPIPPDEDIVSLLAGGARLEVEQRLDHLSRAVASFDSATIATTHGFCQLVLDGLGSAGDVPAGALLLEDPADLIDEVVDDLYLRWALKHERPPDFKRSDARAAVVEAVRNPGISLLPEPGDDRPGLLRRLVERAEREVDRRLQDRNLLTYDHLLSRLAHTLGDADRGPVACDRLRQRYRVVLVDEFQDTDPIQWEVVDRAFGTGPTRLVLVGDPKQAIYSFRGADVHAYLDASAKATVYTLGQNWRTDQRLLDATHALLFPLQMGHEQIRFLSVRAPAERVPPDLDRFPIPIPIRVRLVANNQPGIQRTPTKNLLQKPALVDWIAGDVARDVAALLHASARIGDRAVEPSSLAVLTRTNRQAVAVRDHLRAAGVPAVIAGLDSVFTSDAASDWLRLLEALEEPASAGRAVALGLTPFIGLSAAEVAAAGERTWESVHARAHRWASILQSYGVAALYRSITATEGLPARVVAETGGERRLTDLGHVAQLLHAEAVAGQMGLPTLRAWLARRITEVDMDEAGAEERTRRLDSDDEAVQVLTVHRAKGLEFDIVYCPFLWDSGSPRDSAGPVVFHDPAAGGARSLDVGCPESNGPTQQRYQAHRQIKLAEERGEELRLMYVALTRARHQVVLWWGRADRSRHSPLGRLLLQRDLETGEVGQAYPSEPKDDEIRSALARLAERAGPGLIGIEAAGEPAQAGEAQGQARVEPDLDAARFERGLDLRWRRASYSSITAHVFESSGAAISSEPEAPGLDDEPGSAVAGGMAGRVTGIAMAGEVAEAGAAGAVGGGGAASGPAQEWPPCPLGDLPAGAEFGTFVHGVLEQVDFRAPDFEAAMPATARPPSVDPELLGRGLAAALATPLGPTLPGFALADLERKHRADEMRFELPLAGGDVPAGQVSTADVASVVRHHLPAGGLLAGYPDRLADPLLSTDLRGYLTGSLDLVFRHTGPDDIERWYVADYKTNWLGQPGLPLTAWHYRPAALDAEMQRHHYPLQALLYLVALHRYLCWRQPGYDPAVHLGGVLYLFIRGMVGPPTPLVDGQPCGVFSWVPPAELILELSDLFRSGR